jgi:hypothetical protein
MQGSCRCQVWQAWQSFSAKSGERQKHISALNGALATGCKAPGLYGKKKIPRPLIAKYDLFVIYLYG